MRPAAPGLPSLVEALSDSFYEQHRSRTQAAPEIPAAAHELVDSNPTPPTVVRARVSYFRKSIVLRLKSSTNSSFPDNTKPFSTFQSLTTHARHFVSHARRLPSEAITIFAVFADCRLRIQPSIPNSYFSNLIQAVFTDTVVDALLTARLSSPLAGLL
ncbi:BAHD acyltransferase DCR [Platanthera zijinensis]|uniref:BAHD acyltransferase DCR n=1 Tax=Platanthera zijinensis TaxID=2320716 RepID=A0AAP0GG31_9ASPA